jgi:hypothetical protein
MTMRPNNFRRALVLMVVLLGWVGVVQAAGVEILTPPLRGVVTVFECAVLNASTSPQQVTVEMVDAFGQVRNSQSTNTLLPLHVFILGGESSGGSDLRFCRVTSTDGKHGDLLVTLTVQGSAGCQSAVSAQ